VAGLLDEAVEVWREAETLRDRLPVSSPDHETVALLGLELRRTYQRLATARDSSADRVASARQRVARARGVLRRVRDRLDPSAPGPREPTDEKLEIYIGEDGRYIGANPRALDFLGYTTQEIVALPLGALSGVEPDVAARFWHEFTQGAVHMPAGREGRYRAKDGSHRDVVYLGIERDASNSFYVSRSRPVSAATREGGGGSIPTVLMEWREAERRLARTPRDDPGRATLEAQVEGLRRRYHDESTAALRELLRHT
jgi:PAS domain-containing protein